MIKRLFNYWVLLLMLLLLAVAASSPFAVDLAIKSGLLVPCHEVESCAKKEGIPYRPNQGNHDD